jgi:hypothetical protein
MGELLVSEVPMESPSNPAARPLSSSDALDDLEARALGMLREAGGGVAWDELLVAIDRAEHEGELYGQPPPIDPSEGRKSSAELRRLIAAIRGASPEPPPRASRAGYALEGAPEGEARARPAFAAVIGARGLRDAFPDLWALDAALWNALDTANPRDLARMWLESPGRRLMQDIGILRALPHTSTRGASDLSPERLDKAAGWKLADAPREHRELHLAIPGAALESWEPELADPGEQVPHALRLLEEGSPLGLRGAALAWLLGRAAESPFYTFEGMRRDLREDLPVRLTWALARWLPDKSASVIPRRLEAIAFQHAARLVASDPSADAARRGWALARWRQACLRRSPFYGADEEVLAAHLRARLPVEPQPVPEGADALHPARFTIDGDGLDVAETAFMAGLLAHYQREQTLLPTPEPLVHWLHWLAARPVRSAEEDADAALTDGRNALAWPARFSISPSLAARQLMTDLRIAWIAQAKVDAQSGFDPQRDAIERFARDPARHAWCAFAIEREGQHLRSEVRARAVEVFEALGSDAHVRPHVVATLGAGLLEALTDEQAARILVFADRAEPRWRAHLADAAVGAAERADRDAVWAHAIEHLIALMQDTALPEKVRLDAALFAMRRASASKLPARDPSLQKIATLAAAPPFTDHLGLRREIRRLGLSTQAAAGIKR